MGTIFLVYIYMYVGKSVCLQETNLKKCMQNAWAVPNTGMLKVGFGQLKPTCDTRIIHFDYTLEQLYMDKKKFHLEMRNLSKQSFRD